MYFHKTAFIFFFYNLRSIYISQQFIAKLIELPEQIISRTIFLQGPAEHDQLFLNVAGRGRLTGLSDRDALRSHHFLQR